MAVWRLCFSLTQSIVDFSEISSNTLNSFRQETITVDYITNDCYIRKNMKIKLEWLKIPEREPHCILIEHLLLCEKDHPLVSSVNTSTHPPRRKCRTETLRTHINIRHHLESTDFITQGHLSCFAFFN